MAEQNTEMSAMGIKRYSNEQAKRITKECIETALIQLLERKDMTAISISEIVKKAGVSRTAFYAHYETKEDVVKSALRDTITQIDQIATGDPRQETFWKTLFEETGKLADPFRILLKAGMGQQILTEISEKIASGVPRDTLHRYNEYLWVGAIYNVLTHWVTEEHQETPDKMAAFCSQIVACQIYEEVARA